MSELLINVDYADTGIKIDSTDDKIVLSPKKTCDITSHRGLIYKDILL